MNDQKLKTTDFYILQSFYQDQELMQYISGHPLSLEEIQSKWEMIMSWDNRYGYFAFYEQQQCIGVGCLKPHEDNVEVGYMLYKKYWHQGYGKRICHELLKKVETLGMIKAVAYIDSRNLASKKILLSNGFVVIDQKEHDAYLEKKLKLCLIE